MLSCYRSIDIISKNKHPDLFVLDAKEYPITVAIVIDSSNNINKNYRNKVGINEGKED